MSEQKPTIWNRVEIMLKGYGDYVSLDAYEKLAAELDELKTVHSELVIGALEIRSQRDQLQRESDLAKQDADSWKRSHKTLQDASNAHIEQLQKELDEQLRVNGIGQERELKLMTEIGQVKSESEANYKAAEEWKTQAIEKFELIDEIDDLKEENAKLKWRLKNGKT